MIAEALPDSFTSLYAPTTDDRLTVVAAVLEAAAAVDRAIGDGLDPYPHGVICPTCGKWSDHPRNTCVGVRA